MLYFQGSRTLSEFTCKKLGPFSVTPRCSLYSITQPCSILEFKMIKDMLADRGADRQHLEPRRISCERCRRQKLQCRFEEEKDDCCIRCRRCRVDCTTKAPRRVGRPRGATAGAGDEPGRQKRKKQRQERASVSTQGDHLANAPNEEVSDTNVAVVSPSNMLQEYLASTSLSWSDPSTTALGASESINCLPLSSSNTENAAEYDPTANFDSFVFPDYAPLDRFEPAVDLSRQNSIGPMDEPQRPAQQSTEPNSHHEIDGMSGAPEFATQSKYHCSSASDAKEDCMQRLWNLQSDLYRQSRRVSSISPGYDLGARQEATNTPTSRHNNDTWITYPIGEILDSCDAFLQILDLFERTATNSAASSASASSVSSGTPSPTVRNANPLNFGTADNANTDGWAAELGKTSLFQGQSIHTISSRKQPRSCVIELDTPALCMILTCYSRLIDIFGNLFAYLQSSLFECLSSSLMPLGAFPDVQLGDFRPQNSGHIKVVVLVQVCVHMLIRIERILGLPNQVSAAGAGAGKFALKRPVDGVLSKSAGVKLMELMRAQEAEGGIDDRKRTMELRLSIENVKRLSEQIMAL